MTKRDLQKSSEPGSMHPVAKALWSLLVLVAFVLALAFTVPLLIHVLIQLPQWGWGLVS